MLARVITDSRACDAILPVPATNRKLHLTEKAFGGSLHETWGWLAFLMLRAVLDAAAVPFEIDYLSIQDPSAVASLLAAMALEACQLVKSQESRGDGGSVNDAATAADTEADEWSSVLLGEYRFNAVTVTGSGKSAEVISRALLLAGYSLEREAVDERWFRR